MALESPRPGVLPLNCPSSGNNALENPINALKTVNLYLIPNNVVDDCTRHQAGRGESRAIPMHPLKQGASLVIDERNVLKIHQNFCRRGDRSGRLASNFQVRGPNLRPNDRRLLASRDRRSNLLGPSSY